MSSTITLSGVGKVAILLLQLGHDRATRILSQLREPEVEEITAEIVRLQQVQPEDADFVLTEFHDLLTARKVAVMGGFDLARDLLESSLGRDKAQAVIDRLRAVMVEMPFKFLRRADARQVLSFLQEEHPQTIALVLAHMPASSAALVLSGLEPGMQAEVAIRIARMDRTSPEIIRTVEAQLERRFSAVIQSSELSNVGGLDPLVEMINRADRTTERLLLENLENKDAELAEEVRSRMFMFEDIVTIDDRSIQLVLRQVESAELVVALKGVSDDVKERILRNLSARAREGIVDEMDLLGPIRLKQVEEAQAKVVQAIRQLEASGQLVISRGGEDEFVD